MSRQPFELKLWPAQVQDAQALVSGLISIRNSLSSTRAEAGILADELARVARKQNEGTNAPPDVSRRRVARHHIQSAEAIAGDVSRAMSGLDLWIDALEVSISKAGDIANKVKGAAR